MVILSPLMRTEVKRNSSLAYPIILGMMGNVLVGLVDTVMVGKLGSSALGSVSIANSCFYPFLLFAIGISTAMTPLISKARGEKNAGLCSRILAHGTLLNGLVGLLMIPFFEGVIACLPYMDQSPEVTRQAIPYLRIVSYSVFPIMLFQSLRQCAEGLAYTKFNLYTSLVVNLLNIVCNYIFIFGVAGLVEPMGVTGAAYGTLAARFLLVPIGLLMGKTHAVFWMTIKQCKWFSIQKDLLAKIWNLGYSTGFQMFFETAAFAAAAVFSGMINTSSLAAHQISINLAVVSFSAAQGIGSAIMIRAGFHYGRKDFHGIQASIKAGYINTFLLMVVCGLVFIFGRNFLPTLFTDDPEVIRITIGLLLICALFQLSDGLQVAGLGSLRGLQDVKIPMLIVFGCYWLISLPMGYLFGVHLGYGTHAVWLSLAAGLTVAAVSLYYRLKWVQEHLIKNHT